MEEANRISNRHSIAITEFNEDDAQQYLEMHDYEVPLHNIKLQKDRLDYFTTHSDFYTSQLL